MSSAREKIFSDIRAALQSLPRRTPRPEIPYGVADAQRLTGEGDSVDLFVKRALAVGTLCFFDIAECVEQLRTQNVHKIYVPAEFSEISSWLEKFFEVTHNYLRDEVDCIEAAFTPAAGGIAESGTIILTDESTPDRLAALAPWTHFAILPKSAIYRSIADALATMPDDPNVVWVTGPSKTADVEGILIQGVHGPGIQACLLV